MKKGGLYAVWIEKYGQEEADRRMVEYRSKMKKKTAGKKNGFYGKTHSDETKEQLSKHFLGKPSPNRGKKLPSLSGDLNPSKRAKVREKISDGVLASYTDELRNERSKHFKKLRAETKDEFRKTMEDLGHWTPIDQKDPFDLYRQKVRDLSQKTYSTHIDEIDPDRLRGRKYHLDHIVSIYDGFQNGVSPEILAHVCNLRIVHHSLNESKFNRSEMTIEELYTKINSRVA